MSKTISIKVSIASNDKVSALFILKTLINTGWNPMVNRLINYLPEDDNDLYNWTNEKISIDHMFEIIKKKEQKKESIGIDLYWKDSGVGVSLLITNSYELSFNLDINRRYIDENTHILDFNWYAMKIIPALCELCHVTKYSFEYYY